MDTESQTDHELNEEKLKKEGFKKVRTYIGNDKYLVRYLPQKYIVRTDEEVVFEGTTKEE
jgi:hypothetical protein